MINKKQYQGMVDDITFYREGVDIINQQITNAIKNVEKSSLPDSRNIEQMSNWLAKSLFVENAIDKSDVNWFPPTGKEPVNNGFPFLR